MMAELVEYIRYSIVASIEALFILLGFPDVKKCQLALSVDKVLKSACLYKRVQLGILIDTRSMTVSLPEDKRELMCSEIKCWHKGQKSTTLRELSILMGHIVHLSNICHQGMYLPTELQHSITIALHMNKNHISLTRYFTLLTDKMRVLSSNGDCVFLDKTVFYSSQISKSIWACMVIQPFRGLTLNVPITGINRD